jgi:hypothetical protein
VPASAGSKLKFVRLSIRLASFTISHEKFTAYRSAAWRKFGVSHDAAVEQDHPFGARTCRARLCQPSWRKPFLERTKMDLRIAPAEPFDVCFEAGMIQAVEHLVELFAENETDNRKRQSPELYLDGCSP